MDFEIWDRRTTPWKNLRDSNITPNSRDVELYELDLSGRSIGNYHVELEYNITFHHSGSQPKKVEYEIQGGRYIINYEVNGNNVLKNKGDDGTYTKVAEFIIPASPTPTTIKFSIVLVTSCYGEVNNRLILKNP